MPHPFFDVPFPWERDEAKTFHEKLFNAISVAGDVDLVYRQAGGTTPLTPQRVDLMWKEAIDFLSAAQRLRKLCEILSQRPEWPTLGPSVAAIETATDLLDVSVLVNDRIFVDRINLRNEVLKLCGSGASHGVLLVRGATQSG